MISLSIRYRTDIDLAFETVIKALQKPSNLDSVYSRAAYLARLGKHLLELESPDLWPYHPDELED